jgi:hypothetical protein
VYIEESIFYPAAQSAVPDTTDHVLESVEEHHMVVWMMSELSKLDPADKRYDAKVTVLIENVHHVEDEEKEWSPGPQGEAVDFVVTSDCVPWFFSVVSPWLRADGVGRCEWRLMSYPRPGGRAGCR